MKNQTLRLTETGVLLGIAAVLTVIQPFQLPFGGGITIASMLPVVLLSYRYGVKWGLFSAFVFSLIQIATGFGNVRGFFLPQDGLSTMQVLGMGICIVLLDYVAAYTVLGLGGLFRKRLSPSLALGLGTFTALGLRYLVHIISGALFFGSWAEWFFTQEGFYAIGDVIMAHCSGTELALIYSVFYNGLYMIPEILLTTIAALIVARVPYLAKKREPAAAAA